MQATWNLVSSFSISQHTWLRRLSLTFEHWCPFLVLLEHSDLALSKYTNGRTTLAGLLASITDVGERTGLPSSFLRQFQHSAKCLATIRCSCADINKQVAHLAGGQVMVKTTVLFTILVSVQPRFAGTLSMQLIKVGLNVCP